MVALSMATGATVARASRQQLLWQAVNSIPPTTGLICVHPIGG
jgi:hypothetical protein